MANKTYYERGDTFVDASEKPAIIKRGNELTFTDDFKAGGGADLAPATAETLGGVKVGNGLNVANDGTLSVAGVDYTTDEVNTGRKWVDGSSVYEKVFFFENGINIPGSGATIEETTPVNLILNAWVSDGIHGYAPIQASVESDILKAFAISGSLDGIKYVTITYTKTPTPTLTTTRKSKKG